MKSFISIEAANTFLRCVCGLCVTQVDSLNDGTFVIGLGPLFRLSHMALRNTEVVEDCVIVSQYQILTSAGVTTTDTGGFSATIANKEESEIESARELLVGKIVRNAQINNQNELCLTLERNEGPLFLTVRCWSVIQPGTEEDRLTATAEKITKETRQFRRWSHKFSAERDKWHTLPLESKPDSPTSPERALEFLQAFIGMRVLYAKKSPDMILYDIGFAMTYDGGGSLVNPDSALHAACKLIIKEQNGKERAYYGDSEKSQFEKAFSHFYSEEIREISLLAGNVLRIGFNSGAIEVIPADDEEESWRFLETTHQRRHLVASNTWLWLQE